MEVQVTTATNKIAGLSKKVKVIQGGQGAGKTFSILLILINHALSVPNQEIIIASAELSKMRLTVIKDYQKLLVWFIENYGIICQPKDNYIFTQFPNGSFIRFISADKSDIGKGLRSNVFFINEANKCNFEFYLAIASRSKNIYIDFNPDREFWVHKELLKESKTDFIKLTFQDNEQLGEEEKDSILDYKRKGYNEDGTIKNEYWANKWRVYGLGEIGIQVDAVFQNYREIEMYNEKTNEDYDYYSEADDKHYDYDDEESEEDANNGTIYKPNVKPIIDLEHLLGFGLDFGFTDPNALVAMYKYDDKIIFEEWIYQTGLSISQLRELMRKMIEDRGYDPDFFWERTLVLCDSSSPTYIEELRQNNFRAFKCSKADDAKRTTINELNARGFYVSNKSKNLIGELQKYTYVRDKDGRKTEVTNEKDDHLIDAMRYVYWHFKDK